MTCAIYKIPYLHPVRFIIWILRGEIRLFSCGCIKVWNKTRNMANLEHVLSLPLPQQAESQSTLLLL